MQASSEREMRGVGRTRPGKAKERVTEERVNIKAKEEDSTKENSKRRGRERRSGSEWRPTCVASSHESRAGNARDRKGRRGRNGGMGDGKKRKQRKRLARLIPLSHCKHCNNCSSSSNSALAMTHAASTGTVDNETFYDIGHRNVDFVDSPTPADLAVYDFLESPFPGLKALGVELAEFSKVLAVAEAVAKDP